MNSSLNNFLKSRPIKYKYFRDIGPVGRFFYNLYRINKITIRKLILRLFYHILGQHYQFYSVTLRRIFADYHNITVGEYSHGGCFNSELIPSGTIFGRYCSVARNVSIHSANHPHNTLSSHGFFFNISLGITEKKIVNYTQLIIGNDVFIGQNTTILPSCSIIGDGAVIGAACVVNKNIPPFAIVVGNPGRIVGYRFSREKIEEIQKGKWWDKPIYELVVDIEDFQKPIDSNFIR